MKRINSAIYILVLVIAAFASTAFGQNEKFSSPNVDYTFTLPDVKWKQTVKPSETSPNVEYVYSDRNDGHLEVRKLAVRKEVLTTDAIRDEEEKLQFLPGYVGGKEENFAGRHRGVIFNYEFVRTGRPMSGRMYFLRVNDTTVYVLRFTGRKDSLRAIQNQTDSIARTFSVS
jgi:hypothetical protein